MSRTVASTQISLQTTYLEAGGYLPPSSLSLQSVDLAFFDSSKHEPWSIIGKSGYELVTGPGAPRNLSDAPPLHMLTDWRALLKEKVRQHTLATEAQRPELELRHKLLMKLMPREKSELVAVVLGLVPKNVSLEELVKMVTPESQPLPASEEEVKGQLSPYQPTFVFLSVFKWEMRKGWDILLKAFIEEFHVR